MNMENHSQKTGPPSQALRENKRTLGIALAITASMMLIEAAGGFLSGSLALLADAGHMLTDVAALGLSLFAFWLSSRPKTFNRTFGWHRFEIFAAFVNGIALWIIAGVIGYEAFKRLTAPPEVKSSLMMIIAALGLASNMVVGALLFHRRSRSLNIKGAFLHVLADALGSVGVLAAGLLIKITGSYVWDPIVSAGVSVLILWSSGRLVRDSFHVLMEGAPSYLNVAAIQEALSTVPGVKEVHDLHIWTITSGFVSLSAHLKIAKGLDVQEIIKEAHGIVSARFNVLHSTFQPEIAEDAGCETACCPENPAE
jgi:cobalt-zinc-cadmium efflux system protein